MLDKFTMLVASQGLLVLLSSYYQEFLDCYEENNPLAMQLVMLIVLAIADNCINKTAANTKKDIGIEIKGADVLLNLLAMIASKVLLLDRGLAH